jgi:hypothetical protein
VGIATSIFLILAGVALCFAASFSTSGLSTETVGAIVMAAGALGLCGRVVNA